MSNRDPREAKCRDCGKVRILRPSLRCKKCDEFRPSDGAMFASPPSGNGRELERQAEPEAMADSTRYPERLRIREHKGVHRWATAFMLCGRGSPELSTVSADRPAIRIAPTAPSPEATSADWPTEAHRFLDRLIAESQARSRVAQYRVLRAAPLMPCGVAGCFICRNPRSRPWESLNSRKSR